MNNASSHPVDYAKHALGAYLTRMDLQLARAGLTRSERDAICRQSAEQFHDLLSVPIDQATPEQIDAAMLQLASVWAFENDEIVTRGQALRMAWRRFWIGTPIPLALNDHGRTRVMWGELIKRMLWMFLFFILATFFGHALMGVQRSITASLIVSTILFLAVSHLIVIKLRHMPSESLPPIEDWTNDRQRQNRFGWLLIASAAFLFVPLVVILVYWIVAASTNHPVWPMDHALLRTAHHCFFIVAFAVLGVHLFRRRQRRRRFERWAAGEMA